MFCTNEPCENETVPESGDLHLCRTCLHAWQRGFRQWSQAKRQATTYHLAEGAECGNVGMSSAFPSVPTHTHLPGPSGEDYPLASLAFKDLFQPIPAGRVPCGFFELGEWLGNTYEAEFQVSLLLGPDGKVWTEIGDLEDLPFLAERDRETLAAQMVAEFLEACDDGEPDPDDGNPTRAALRAWPVPRVMHWLQRPATLRRADPAQRRMITSLLGELRGLGFRPRP